MESAWPMLMFLAGLMGAGMLILVCGIKTREEERAEATDLALAATPERSFFATLGAAFEVPLAVDADVVSTVEHHVRRQAEVANRFVERPSIDTFHDVVEDGTPRLEFTLFHRIQGFLERERALASAFVMDPSLDRLHGQLAFVTV